MPARDVARYEDKFPRSDYVSRKSFVMYLSGNGSTRLFVLLQSDASVAVDWAEAHCIDFGRRLQASEDNIRSGNWHLDRGGEGNMSTFSAPYFMYLVVFDGFSLNYTRERAQAADRAPKWWQDLPRLPT